MNLTIQQANAFVLERSPVYFTGFRRDMEEIQLIGQFLFHGTAEFNSGRIEPVFYYVVVKVFDTELSTRFLWAKIEDAMHTVEKFMDAPKKYGVLLSWKSGRRARPVKKVEWLQWASENKHAEKIPN